MPIRHDLDSHTQLMSTISMERNVSSPFRMYFQRMYRRDMEQNDTEEQIWYRRDMEHMCNIAEGDLAPSGIG